MTDPIRRNLSAERRTEILEAFERCIVLHGLDKSSMRVVAAEAGVSQPLLAHHFGSRAGLIRALVHHVIEGYLAEDRKLEVELTPGADVGELLDHMMGPGFALPHYDRLLDELAAASHRDAEVQSELGRLYRALEESVVALLTKALPAVPIERIRETAYTLHPLIEGVQFLQARGFPDDRLRAAQRGARQLVEVLKAETLVSKKRKDPPA